jgi:hypothetical protein
MGSALTLSQGCSWRRREGVTSSLQGVLACGRPREAAYSKNRQSVKARREEEGPHDVRPSEEGRSLFFEQ